ncbi:E3 ubiquitin-protein ligase RNF126 isoform X2 [Apteryx rowi]|uniref:E3 ubiquitin-protein ligase RNF126 isoform X2 n=1 Tax=Apteryx rowi TaxID=308060 RepID=UPI000E1CAA1D|nr:E3 ubiquitin-protein ligase RNF126 isoform X2 [Apteryx rowi]
METIGAGADGASPPRPSAFGLQEPVVQAPPGQPVSLPPAGLSSKSLANCSFKPIFPPQYPVATISAAALSSQGLCATFGPRTHGTAACTEQPRSTDGPDPTHLPSRDQPPCEPQLRRLPDYICPRCESGFIEELPEEPRNTDNETSSSTSTSDQSRHPFENVDQHLFTLPQGYGQFAFGIFDDSFEFPFGSNVQSEDNRDSENRREREHQSRHRYGARQPRARLATRRAAGRHEGVPTLEGIIQQLVNGIIAPTTIPNLGLGPWGVLHSNPMDYAWGANGLDAIITQLLNQFENTGPPPADKEKIQALPTIQITQEHVDSGLECPVCKEDYTVGENVRQLPCNHLFHNSCIVPWLEQSCPSHSLNGLFQCVDIRTGRAPEQGPAKYHCDQITYGKNDTLEKNVFQSYLKYS